MALLETLRERAGQKNSTAQVDCGELGVLTVEALSPADCASLAGDGRALLYAACRELQSIGEELRREGKIYRPDEVMAYLLPSEVETAAQVVLSLSGLSEIRLSPVQALTADSAEIRHQSVQPPAGALAPDEAVWTNGQGIRLSSVQGFAGIVKDSGQVSRESGQLESAFTEEMTSVKKSQILGDLSSRTAQILVSENGEEHQKDFSAASFGEKLHEIESEFGRGTAGRLHETTSDLSRSGKGGMHEIKSELQGRGQITLHETESESAWILHEVKSELRRGLHEIKSEVREMLHENKSELAEAAAERLAEALIQAAQVR